MVEEFFGRLNPEGDWHEVSGHALDPNDRPQWLTYYARYPEDLESILIPDDRIRNWYVGANPVTKPVAYESGQAGRRAKEQHIARLKHLVVDIDSVHLKDQNATDEEVEQAQLLMERVREYMPEQPDIISCTGNGYQLLYKIDQPTSYSSTIQKVLLHLADKFKSDGAKVDTSCFDPPRLVRLIGTTNIKPGTPLGRESHLC